jgi:hypothetical protein
LNDRKTFPAQLFPVVEMELFLDTDIHALISPTNASSFSISNVEFICDRLTTSASYSQRLAEHVNTNGLVLKYPTFVGTSQQIPAVAGEQTINLQTHRELGIVYFGMITNAHLASATTDSINTFTWNNLENYQCLFLELYTHRNKYPLLVLSSQKPF